MSIEITQEQLDEMKEEAKRLISRAESLNRLLKNKDFKSVFLEGYVKEECVRLVNLTADPNINMSNTKEAVRKDIEEKLIGIARFSEYLRTVDLLAKQANKTMEDIKEHESASYIQ